MRVFLVPEIEIFFFFRYLLQRGREKDRANTVAESIERARYVGMYVRIRSVRFEKELPWEVEKDTRLVTWHSWQVKREESRAARSVYMYIYVHVRSRAHVQKIRPESDPLMQTSQLVGDVACICAAAAAVDLAAYTTHGSVKTRGWKNACSLLLMLLLLLHGSLDIFIVGISAALGIM